MAGVFERPLVKDSPRLKELIRNGTCSKQYAHYHEYQLPPAVLCTRGQEGCSVERAYEAQVVLRTFGIGNNSSAFRAEANVEGAAVAFAEPTDRIKAIMDPEGQKRLRDGWHILAPGPSRLTP